MVIKFLEAGKGDCFLISFIDDANNKRNILIDGGVSRTYYDSTHNRNGELKLEIDKIKENKEQIDLLILTHIDEDHICGLLKWFEMDEKAHEVVKDVWFNSGKLIADYLSEPENPDLQLGLNIFNSPYTSVSQAINFEEYLLNNNIWERKIIKEGTNIRQSGVDIKVLSPNDEQLKKLLKEYKKKTGDLAYTSGKSKDWHKSFKELIEDEKENYVEPKDGSLPNQSSISFILTVENKSFLFSADAPSEQIVKALDVLGYSKESPLEVEFMKVSHHGSQNSTSNELLEIIKTNNYLISTDSSGHAHPDKRTLARILRFNPNAFFHFNYEGVKAGVISTQDWDDFKGLKASCTKEFPYGAK